MDRYIVDLGMATPQVKKIAGRSGQASWCMPPLAGITKVNVDAVVSKNVEWVLAVAIAHDVNGLFLGASAMVMTGMTDPETMEVLACKEGMVLAQDLLSGRIRLASVCSNVVRCIKAMRKRSMDHVVLLSER